MPAIASRTPKILRIMQRPGRDRCFQRVAKWWAALHHPFVIPESSGSLYWEKIADEIKADGLWGGCEPKSGTALLRGRQ
jgi:hypothetical protein